MAMSALKFAEGYTKPKETREFSKSARKRASLQTLGSITNLQRYYASGGQICEGLGDFNLSYVDVIGSCAGMLPPSSEDLLRECYLDIQSVLEVWGIITYPTPSAHAIDGIEQALDSPISLDEFDTSRQLGFHHLKEGSVVSTGSRRYDEFSIDLLALLESSTKAISSIRNYSMHAPAIPTLSLKIHRQAALSVLEMLSVLEQQNRILDQELIAYHQQQYDMDEDEAIRFLMMHSEGYCYSRLKYGDLAKEREEMKSYLKTVQEHLLRSPKDRLERQLEMLVSPVDQAVPFFDFQQMQMQQQQHQASQRLSLMDNYPAWMMDGLWKDDDGDHGDISLERCHAFLEFYRPASRAPIPSPSEDRQGFIRALSDGFIMCSAFNSFLRATSMPFGYVDKFHQDTKRTWRGSENWRFLRQACKFRLEFKIPDETWVPLEIAKRTEVGQEQLLHWVKQVVYRGIQETKEWLEISRASPSDVVPVVPFDF
ncbi:hypothetical protein DFQ27_009773 [Actinomortierella ambigua]|uniref:Uncharacterized protein n=1 Tax=Actinomortierella ambigua TaxID=1343610 RepID=A0A9P6TWP7_9FUNG|nr:hypothetical protein DFQ27_009773 [Actinomortierella ambigua]